MSPESHRLLHEWYPGGGAGVRAHESIRARLDKHPRAHPSMPMRQAQLWSNPIAEIDMFRLNPLAQWPESFWLPQLRKFMNGGGCVPSPPPPTDCPGPSWSPCDPGQCEGVQGCCTIAYASVRESWGQVKVEGDAEFKSGAVLRHYIPLRAGSCIHPPLTLVALLPSVWYQGCRHPRRPDQHRPDSQYPLLGASSRVYQPQRPRAVCQATVSAQSHPRGPMASSELQSPPVHMLSGQLGTPDCGGA